MRYSRTVAAALFAATMLAAQDLAAFTIDEKSGTNPDGSARYVDPDDQPLPAPLGGLTITGSGGRFDEGSATSSGSSASNSRDSDMPGWFSSSIPRH